MASVLMKQSWYHWPEYDVIKDLSLDMEMLEFISHLINKLKCWYYKYLQQIIIS